MPVVQTCPFNLLRHVVKIKENNLGYRNKSSFYSINNFELLSLVHVFPNCTPNSTITSWVHSQRTFSKIIVHTFPTTPFPLCSSLSELGEPPSCVWTSAMSLWIAPILGRLPQTSCNIPEEESRANTICLQLVITRFFRVYYGILIKSPLRPDAQVTNQWPRPIIFPSVNCPVSTYCPVIVGNVFSTFSPPFLFESVFRAWWNLKCQNRAIQLIVDINMFLARLGLIGGLPD